MKYIKIKEAADQLRSFAKEIDNNDNLSEHFVLITAGESRDDSVLQIVAEALFVASSALKAGVEKLESLAEKESSNLDEEDIHFIAALADEFDSDGDPVLRRQASVLEQVLLNFAQKGELEKAKKLAEDEIDKLRKEYRDKAVDKNYKEPRESYNKDTKVSESAKAVEKQIERVHPSKNHLSTRYCPDHPGASITRIADGIFQCSLDNKIYNYNDGFETMKGNKIPGGTVSGQTQSLGGRAVEQMEFATRQNRISE